MIESWIFSEDQIQFQGNWIQFHDITFSFKFTGIHFQTISDAIQIQFFNTIIQVKQYKFKLCNSNSVFSQPGTLVAYHTLISPPLAPGLPPPNLYHTI